MCAFITVWNCSAKISRQKMSSQEKQQNFINRYASTNPDSNHVFAKRLEFSIFLKGHFWGNKTKDV